MIILYIPFSSNAAGDLSNAAELWKQNHTMHSQEPLMVIYHQDDYDPDLISADSKVYILAHGYEENPNQVANSADGSQAIFLSMQTVAMRFQYDLFVVSHNFKTVHTYFCGSKKNNHERASNFQIEWLRKEQAPIHYYDGSVATPDSNGDFWAISNNNNQLVPLQSCRQTLEPESIQEETSRTDVKMTTLSKNKARHYEGARERFFERGREGRQDLFASRRGRVTMMECNSEQPQLPSYGSSQG